MNEVEKKKASRMKEILKIFLKYHDNVEDMFFNIEDHVPFDMQQEKPVIFPQVITQAQRLAK